MKLIFLSVLGKPMTNVDPEIARSTTKANYEIAKNNIPTCL